MRLFPIERTNGSIIWLNPQHIVSVEPMFGDGQVWTHCRIVLATQFSIEVNASIEQIEEAAEQAITLGASGWMAA